jgi:hypothetical protein
MQMMAVDVQLGSAFAPAGRTSSSKAAIAPADVPITT